MLKQFRFKKIKINQKIKVNKTKRTKTVTRHAFRVIQLETNAKTIQVQIIKINQKMFWAIRFSTVTVKEDQITD